MKHLSAVGVITLLGLVLLPATASAVCTGNTNTNLVRNPGFETGSDFTITDWTVYDPSDSNLRIVNNEHKSGTQSLEMETVGGENRISQTVKTTAGSVYTVCFWLAPGDAIGTSSFRAQWDNQDMIVLKNIGVSPGNGTFAYYEFHVTAAGSDLLSFEERNDPNEFWLDNIDVQLCDSCTLHNGMMQPGKKQTFTPFKQ